MNAASDAPAVPVAEVKNLTVRFPVNNARNTLRALNDVSLSVTEGETLGVIGESGCGKSTLARVLVGLQKPTQGGLKLDGWDPWAASATELRRRRAAYQIVFQDPGAAFNPRMTIGRSLLEPLELQRQGSAPDRENCTLAMLDRVGLPARYATRYPHELSGGQKQRANLARALTLQPRLIVCDEVVAALDVSIQAEVVNLLIDLQQEIGLTYVFISHDLAVVAHLSERIAVMYLGALVELGPASEVARAPQHPYTSALHFAAPELMPSHLRGTRPPPLQGELPSPLAPPSGCVFRTRCPKAAALCAQKAPEWRMVNAQHGVACHFAP